MKPTRDELLNEDGLKSVLRVADDSWRHGCYITQVFWREADGTFWEVTYPLQTDGEYHGLRDDAYECYPVMPYQEQVTKYRKVSEEVV